MRDEAWVMGMTELVVSFPDRDQDPEVLRARGAVYRRELGSLTDEAWLYAARESIRTSRWFPTVAELLDLAGRAPVMAPRAALPDDTRTPDEKRAAARQGLELIRAEVAKSGAVPRTVATAMPQEERRVMAVDWDRRMELLRAQAREIGGAAAEAVAEIERSL